MLRNDSHAEEIFRLFIKKRLPFLSKLRSLRLQTLTYDMRNFSVFIVIT